MTVQVWWDELRVVVQRGWDIEPWPRHPDHWKGATEKELFEHTNQVLAETHSGNFQNCYGGCFSTSLPVNDGVIIPPGADRVEIVLGHDAGVPLLFKLLYHAGDTWEFAEATPSEETPTRSLYVIEEVTPPQTDPICYRGSGSSKSRPAWSRPMRTQVPTPPREPCTESRSS